MASRQVRIDEDLYSELEQIEKSDDVPVHRQVTRAVREYLARRKGEK